MDHLPLPKTPFGQRPYVRLYENVPYDGKCMGSYLERRNTSERILAEQLSSSNPVANLEAHGVLQTWTYFGVICVLIKAPGDLILKQLTQETDSGLVVDTSKFQGIIPTWITWVHAQTLPDFQRQSIYAEHVQFLGRMFQVYLRLKLSLPSEEKLDSSLWLSVTMLYDYLHRASRFAFGQLDGPPQPLIASASCVEPLLQQMSRNGWCEGEIYAVRTMCGFVDLWFMSFLEHPHPEKDHSDCSESRCVAYQTDEKSYETKHTTKDCSCSFVYAEQDDLNNVLLNSSEAIPLIRAGRVQMRKGRESKDKSYIEVVSSHTAGKVLPYVAISHLWSDGLGNNKENAIPTCQFDWLSNLVASFHDGPLYFWLDTLCFPLQPKEAYSVALIRMKETYAAANKVVVLDHYLMSSSTKEVSFEETIARILISPWNRRLWTFQEAQLAPTGQLYFQFKEEIVPGLQLLHYVCSYGTLPALQKFQRTWAVSFYFAFQTLCGTKLTVTMEGGVLSAKKVLAFRTTSNAIDESLCLGNLMGWNVKPLLETDDSEQRMKVFWDLMRQNIGDLHASVLFWPSPKLSIPGYNWAPATLMHSDMSDVQQQQTNLNGLVLGHSRLGLHVRLLALEMERFPISDTCRFFKTKSNPAHYYGLSLKHTSKSPEIPGRRGFVIRKSRRFVLLLPYPPGYDLMGDSSSTSFDVILAAVSSRGSNRAHLIASGTLCHLDNVSLALNMGLFPDEGPEMSVARLSVLSSTISIAKNQSWHID